MFGNLVKGQRESVKYCIGKEFSWPDLKACGNAIDTNHGENFMKFERWSIGKGFSKCSICMKYEQKTTA